MYKFLLFIVSLGLWGCINHNQDTTSVPPEIKEVPNVEIYNADQNPDSVNLTKVKSYGDRPEEDLYFRSMGDFTVDRSGRVYITDGAKGEKFIYVFDSTGEYITSLGGEGRGPREFIDLCCLKTTDDSLFVYDNQQFKMNKYSIDPLKYSNSVLLDGTNFAISDKSKNFSHDYYFLTDSTYLIGFRTGAPTRETKGEQRYTDYYIADKDWNIISDKLFEQLLPAYEWGEYQGTPIYARYPFFKKSIEAVSNQGRIYRAHTDHFLIKRYNSEGEYLDAFYYPYQKIEVTREDALNSANKMSKNMAESMELPDYWPVLNSMQFDDENRLWITTFTENTEKLKWWVLDHTGQLIATFMWPGKRVDQAYGLKEDVVIRNGYFYTKHKNPDTGQVEVIQYEIKIIDS